MEKDSRFEQVMNMSDQKGDVNNMCDVLDRAEERGAQKTTVSNIKSLISNLNMTPKQAMDALNIPAADQAKYAELLSV